MTAKTLPPGDRPLKTLERVISKSGLGSRREARSWIAAGRVAVNGETVIDPDRWIDLELDRVDFDDAPLPIPVRVYLALHKPVGTLTAHRDPEKRPTVYDLIPDRETFLFSVGRLDFDTSGLLLITNDAQFAERITNPEHGIPKTYRVTASRPLTTVELEALRRGVVLSDGPARPALVDRTDDPRTIEMTITEGRNRQVRRMIESLDARVEALSRIRIGPVELGNLEPGAWRELTETERSALLSSRA